MGDHFLHEDREVDQLRHEIGKLLREQTTLEGEVDKNKQ